MIQQTEENKLLSFECIVRRSDEIKTKGFLIGYQKPRWKDWKLASLDRKIRWTVNYAKGNWI